MRSDLGLKKTSVKHVDSENFFEDTSATPDIEVHKEVTIYLTCWLSEDVFTSEDGMYIKSHCIYPTSQMAFGLINKINY